MTTINTKHIDAFYKLATKIIDVNEYKLTHPEIFDDMSRLDNEIFDETYGPGWGRPAWDLEDDHVQPGSVSIAMLDDNDKIKGYIQGYNCTYEDDIEEGNVDNIRWYDTPMQLEKIHKLCDDGKVFYISNMAMEKSIRGEFLKLAINFKKAMKKAGYEYIVMAALSESYKLFFENDQPREKVLRFFGMKPIAQLPTEDQNILLFKIV